MKSFQTRLIWKERFFTKILFVKNVSSLFPLVPSSNSCSPPGHRVTIRKEEITLSKQKAIITTTEKQTTNLLLTSHSTGVLSLFHSQRPRKSCQYLLSFSYSFFLFLLLATSHRTGWRRKWQPTPVSLPGESQGWERLVGCRLWGHTESTQLKRLSSSSIGLEAQF